VLRRAARTCSGLSAAGGAARRARRRAGQVPPGCLPVLAAIRPAGGLAGAALGPVDARAGAAAAAASTTRWPRCGRRGRGIVTAPIHKEALAAAGVPFPGHTEMLQALAAAPAARCRRCA
jgi:4-hydroxythreonine-4-phosphate dehydrogenase